MASAGNNILWKKFIPVFTVALLFVTSCKVPFDLATALGLELENLTVSPNGIVVDKDSPVTFVASPTGFYEWSIVSGSGSIDSVTGVYTPSGGIEYVSVQATDPETDDFGQGTLRFDAGVTLHILVEFGSLFSGDTSSIYAYGGNGGPYTYSLDVDNTGADVTGVIYTAGPVPGTDTVSVTDGTNTATTTITVLDPGTTLPNINYTIPANVTAAVPLSLGQTEVNGGSFTYQNIGTASGVADVDWAAYISTTQDLGGIISQVDTGTAVFLTAGASAIVDFDITWPDEPGDFHIVVQLTTATDVNPGNNIGFTAASHSLDVIYGDSFVPVGGIYPPGGSTIGTFIIENTGSVSGFAPFVWRAYLSGNMVLDAGDVQVSSGSVPATDFDPDELVSANIQWPSTGNTYVILEYGSTDDPASPKTAVSGEYTPPQVDFGPLVGSEPAGGIVPYGTDPALDFSIENFGADTSTGDLVWTAWLSLDMIPGDAGDIQLSSGTITPSLAFGASLSEPLGVWNVPTGTYNLIITWTAPEDINSGNNRIDALASYQVISSVDYEENTPPSLQATALFNESVTSNFTIGNTGTNGSSDLSWQAWLSDDNSWDIGDQSIGGGTVVGGLASGGNYPGSVTFDSPAVDANYYVVVIWTAMDDGNTANNEMVSASSIDIDPPLVNYEVDSVSVPIGADAAGPVSGTFIIRNDGDDDESDAGFSWSIYASTNNAYDPSDFQIDSGVYGVGLDNGDLTAPIPYSGNWPAVGDDYFLIGVLEADNEAASPAAVYASVQYTVVQTDYEINNLTFAVTGAPGAAINGPTQFRIEEINNVDGNFDVAYSVFASLDAEYDGSDIKLTITDPTVSLAGGGIVDINLSGVYDWPMFGSEYYLIIQIDAEDDANSLNNQAVMGPISVPSVAIDENGNGSDDEGPYPANPVAAFTDLITYIGNLQPFELVEINGTTGNAGRYDVYRFVPAPGMTEVYIRLDWFSGTDDMDLFLWTETPPNYEGYAGSFDPDYEILVVDNLIANRSYYLGIHMFGPVNPNESYILSIQGLL